jgi:hypothetical protein
MFVRSNWQLSPFCRLRGKVRRMQARHNQASIACKGTIMSYSMSKLPMQTVSYVGRHEVCNSAFLPSVLQNQNEVYDYDVVILEMHIVVAVAPSQS